MLYYASFILSAPFYALAWVSYWATYGISWVGDVIFDATTCRIWLVLHLRECSKRTTAPAPGGKEEKP